MLEEQHSSESPSVSSHSSSNLAQPKKRRREADPGDEALISSLKEVTAYAKEIKEKKATRDKSPNMHFGMEVAGQLDRLEQRQQAIAKVRIQQVLLNIEYPSSTPDYPHPHHTTLYLMITFPLPHHTHPRFNLIFQT